MKANTDPDFARFKQADFAKAELVVKTSHLRKLQADAGGESPCAMRLNKLLGPYTKVTATAKAKLAAKTARGGNTS